MLTVQQLRKEFDGVVAVDGVSFDVSRGEIFGLLGPNGAGKTTTIRTVLNILTPDAGTITFDGKPFSPEMWNKVGYLPEERGLYKKSKVLNTILYFAGLKHMADRDAREAAMMWLDRFGLTGRAASRVEELSKGNQQKVQFITSVLHRPQLLVLDEPFSGFDPVNQILLKDILLDLRRQNVAIIFSTHQMEQVEKLCDNICLINEGRHVLKGALREIKQQYGANSLHLEYDGDGSFLNSLPNVKKADVYQNYAELELADIDRATDILKAFDGKIRMRKFEIVEPSLQSIFVSVVESKKESRPPEPAVVQSPGDQTVTESTPPDPRIRKALFSFLLTLAITIILVVFNLPKEEPDWLTTGLIGGAAVLTGIRYLYMRNVGASGRRTGSGGGEE